MTEHRFPLDSPIACYVENGKGEVRVHATETDEALVVLEGRDAEEATVGFDGRTLSVVAPSQRLGFRTGEHRLDVTVTVPTGSDLATKLGSSDLATTGELADVEVKSGSGQVGLDTVTGGLRIVTGSGDVGVGAAHGDATVKSGSGDVTLDVAHAGLTVSTGSGDVMLGTAGAETVVKTGSGDLRVGTLTGDVSLTTGSGDLAVDVARRGRVTMKGASGDVRVGVPAGVPVWTDLTTVSGRVASTLESTGAPVEGADHVEVRARVVSGDITLTPVRP